MEILSCTEYFVRVSINKKEGKIMIRRFGSMIGVTLLEILLVLGIAAVIIVMSLRYYSGASSTSQANTYLQQLQAIAAAIESVSMTSGTAASTTTVQDFLGGSTGVWALPWGGG